MSRMALYFYVFALVVGISGEAAHEANPAYVSLMMVVIGALYEIRDRKVIA